MKNNYGWNINSDDSDNYINMCSKIVNDDDVFKQFKSSEYYKIILEHVDKELGQQYYNHIQSVGEEVYQQFFDKFIENDLIGSPIQFLYGGKLISPTTLRYIKNVLDLSSLCGDSDIEKVVEVGAGYGGLCKTVSVLCDFDEYTCIDLPDVVKLQEKYLSNFKDVNLKVKYVPCNDLNYIENVDLFISNYALSELNIETQLNYYDKVIKNSKFVYITYNSIINSNQNYDIILNKLKSDGFEFQNGYVDYGYHDNKIIAAKRV